MSLGGGSYGGTIAVSNGSALVFNSSSNQTLAGVISGGGAFQLGSGVTTLAAANTYSGSTSVSAGMLVFSGTSQSNASTQTYIASGGTLQFAVPSGGIQDQNTVNDTGAGTILKTGAGACAGRAWGTFKMAAGSLIDVQGAADVQVPAPTISGRPTCPR